MSRTVDSPRLQRVSMTDSSSRVSFSSFAIQTMIYYERSNNANPDGVGLQVLPLIVGSRLAKGLLEDAIQAGALRPNEPSMMQRDVDGEGAEPRPGLTVRRHTADFVVVHD